jgi:homoserine dehydrogenase
VVADIIDLAQRISGGAIRPIVAVLDESIRIRSMDDVHSRYYIRLVAADRPGVIAQIAGIFGARRISLTSVIQKEDVHHGNGDRHAEIVFMTHQAHEASVQRALAEIRQLAVVDRIGSVIRVED